MAAGREGRAERLNERLRGAQRANVDDSFSLDLGGLNIPSSTSPAAGEAPTSSSSRGPRLDSDVISAAVHDLASSARRRSARLGSREPYQSPDASSRAAPQDALKSTTPATQDATPSNVASVRTTRLSTIARSAVSTQLGPVRDELGTLPAPSYVRSSPAQTNMSTDMIEEVGESPTHAPGSGKRRRVPLSQAVSSSVRLLDTMASDDTFPASSSPLARRVRRSDATSVRRSTGSVSKLDVGQDADELLGKTGVEESSGEPSEMPSMNEVEQITMDDEVHEPRTIPEPGSPAVAEVEPETEAEAEEGAGPEVEAEAESEPEPEEEPEIRAETEPEPEEEPEISPEHEERHSLDEQDQAVPRAHREDEIAVGKAHATDSTNVRGKKRQRPPREVSPELGSVSAGEEEVEAEREGRQPVPKRKRPSEDPTARKGPGRKRAVQPESSVALQAQEGSESEAEGPRRAKQYKGRRKRSSQGEGDGDTIEITVQRFVHPRRRGQGDDDTDPLLAEIPFANHGGESVVDVFAQVCDEIITTTLAQLRDMVNGASDAAKKKEGRIKIRAIEAYREELNSRLLQHIIHLNHWHSLRRRVRHVQKEKMALREEILRIRGEREQVALRMDAVRIKHEADSKESKYCLDASALMHDVDLAVEQGRDAPGLSGKPAREAELANLELAVSRITQEASSASSSGGMLQQVKDFNAFLERAAIALETR